MSIKVLCEVQSGIRFEELLKVVLSTLLVHSHNKFIIFFRKYS